jgi:hypothetical protein
VDGTGDKLSGVQVTSFRNPVSDAQVDDLRAPLEYCTLAYRPVLMQLSKLLVSSLLFFIAYALERPQA